MRILFAALLGLIAVGAGVSRLAVSGVIIYRVLTGQASFSALAGPLLVIAGLIVVRSLFQYWQNAYSHHTANAVKIGPEAPPLRPLPGAWPRLLRQEPHRRRRAYHGRGHREAGDLLRAVPVADHRLGHRSSCHLRLHGDPRPGDRRRLHRVRLPHHGPFPHCSTAGTRRAASAAASRTASSGRISSTACRGWRPSRPSGQSRVRGRLLAERARHLYRSTMGVVAANGATSGASIFFMAVGAGSRPGPRGRARQQLGRWSCVRCS